MNETIYIKIFSIFLMSFIIDTRGIPLELNSEIIDDTSKLREVREICNDKNGCQSSIKPLQKEKLTDSSNSRILPMEYLNKRETFGKDDGLVRRSTASNDANSNKLTFDVKQNLSKKPENDTDAGKKIHYELDVSVKNIPAYDPRGAASDPYLKLYTKNPKTNRWEFLSETDYKSKTDKGNWTVNLDFEPEKKGTLAIEVWDKDNNTDDFLGSHQINLGRRWKLSPMGPLFNLNINIKK